MPKKKRKPRKPVRRDQSPQRPTPEDSLDDELDAMFPDFLGELPDDETLEAHIATVDEDTYYRDATLMQHADSVLRRIGDGHPTTEGPGGTVTAALAGAPEQVAWDAPPVTALLAGLTTGGFLEASEGRVRPAARVVPWAWPDAAPKERTAVGRVLHATTLGAFLTQTGSEAPAQGGLLTAMALMRACAPGGLHLPAGAAEPGEYEDLQERVRTDLLALEDIGIVQRDGDVFTASPVLLTVLPAVLESVSAEASPV